MTTATKLRQEQLGFTLAPGTYACLVTTWTKLVERFTAALGAEHVRVKPLLADLIGEKACQFVLVDTKVRDLSIWSAPLFLEPSARPTPWLFLVEDIGVSTLLQGVPPISAFFERRVEALDDVFEYLSKRLQTDAERRIEHVSYVKAARSFVVRMQNGRVYLLKLDDIPEADGSTVARCTLSRSRSYFRVVQESGNILEIPWDDVLHHCEPNYEYYKGKSKQSDDSERAVRIGSRVRELRINAGLSVTELAKRVGMQRPNLSRLEAGKHVPALETLERIADALGVSVAALVAVNGRAPVARA